MQTLKVIAFAEVDESKSKASCQTVTFTSQGFFLIFLVNVLNLRKHDFAHSTVLTVGVQETDAHYTRSLCQG